MDFWIAYKILLLKKTSKFQRYIADISKKSKTIDGA